MFAGHVQSTHVPRKAVQELTVDLVTIRVTVGVALLVAGVVEVGEVVDVLSAMRGRRR